MSLYNDALWSARIVGSWQKSWRAREWDASRSSLEEAPVVLIAGFVLFSAVSKQVSS
jgi:hypothetical protein